VTVRRAGQEETDQHAGQSPSQCVIPEDVLIQLFPPDDERLSLETCRGGKTNTLKKEKSASSWLKIHNCLRMHGQQNIKYVAVF
jgi:hypothetical protein